MTSPIQTYFHCKTCLQSGQRDQLAVGLIDPQTISIECETCDQHVGTFSLAEPLTNTACAVCGGGLGHTH